jgi:hypothetical protein
MATSERSVYEDQNFEVTFETSFGSLIVKHKKGGQSITIRPSDRPGDEGLLVIPSVPATMTTANGSPALLLKGKKEA